MKKYIYCALFVLAATLSVLPAKALAVVSASFTVSDATDPGVPLDLSAGVQAGMPIQFDASASTCNSLICTYAWTWYWRSTDGTTTHIGGQMGRTAVVNYIFTGSAASHPYIIVQLVVSGCPTRLCPVATKAVSFQVLP